MTKSSKLSFFATLIMPVVGVLCIIFPHFIAKHLPVVMGSAMILLGGVHISLRIAKALLHKDTPKRTDITFVIFILGIVIIVMGDESLQLIGTVWGLYGLWQSCYSFHKGVTALHRREKFVLHFLICIIRLVIALLLLFDPIGAFSHHIVILGIDILIDTIKGPHSHKQQSPDSFFARFYADNQDLLPKRARIKTEEPVAAAAREPLDIFHDIGSETDDSDLRRGISGTGTVAANVPEPDSEPEETAAADSETATGEECEEESENEVAAGTVLEARA